MVKSVLGVNHQGLREWVIQRISAIVLAAYFLGLFGYFICHSDLTFPEWHYLFSRTWMKVFTMLTLTGLLFHAWIGMWTIFTDYIKPYVLRAIVDAFVILSLAACFYWGLLILWSV